MIKLYFFPILLTYGLWTNISHANINNRSDIKSTKDSIVLSLYEIQKGCISHKSYTTARNYIALVSLRKACKESNKLPIDSTAKKGCEFFKGTDIEERKIACGRHIIGQKYSEDSLGVAFQKHVKEHPCDQDSDPDVCYLNFMKILSNRAANDSNECQDINKYYYEHLCSLFKDPQAYYERLRQQKIKEEKAKEYFAGIIMNM